MGMLVSQLILGEAQAVAAVGTTGSTSSYAAGNAASGDAGQTGENLWVQALCSTTATSGGAATLQVLLQTSTDNATWVTVASGQVFALAALVAGAVLFQQQPPPGMLQYWRVAYVVGIAALTAGAFDAFISNTIERNINQPSGFTVL